MPSTSREEKGRWYAVWYEDGKRQQTEAGTEQKLAAKLEKVTERLAADAPNMKCPGADLISHYLDPDRLPVDERWSRKHADIRRRLCERFAAPVIAAATCQDIKTSHTQKIINDAPTRHDRPVPRLARWMLVLGILASLAVNVTQGWSHGLLERLTDTEFDTAEHAYTWHGHADAARPGHLEHQPTSVTPTSSLLMPPGIRTQAAVGRTAMRVRLTR